VTKSIHYYNTNAQDFYKRAYDADLSDSYQAFQEHLPEKACILDAGCGFGRDITHFLKQGYNVTAFDASKEMRAMALKETKISILDITFQDMNFRQEFDGVWAQASLLHIPYQETRAVYQRIHKALKPEGIFYASYKYGNAHMPTPERDFWNMDENMIQSYFEGLFDVITIWTQKDKLSKLAPSPKGLWLKFVVRKKG